MTYVGESNPSFSANCNILNALLHMPNLETLNGPIELAINFLCDSWDEGQIDDKWVNSQVTLRLKP